MVRDALAAPRRLFYGWRMVGIGAVFAGFTGGFHQNAFSVFFLPISSDLQQGRASTSLIIAMARAEAALVSPAAGWLIDRLGVRRMLLVGGAWGCAPDNPLLPAGRRGTEA